MGDCYLLSSKQIFQLYHSDIMLYFDEMMMMIDACFVLDQHAELDNYSSNSLNRQFRGRYAALQQHIILIQSQIIFALIPQHCLLS